MMKYYTYMHTRNDTGETFYIGKGQNKRAWGKGGRNSKWHEIASTYGYSVTILSTWETERESLDHEELLIDCFRELSSCLVNKAKNGDVSYSLSGPNHPYYGKKRPEHSEWMKKYLADGNHPSLGTTNINHSKRMTGKGNPMYGTIRPDHSKRMTGKGNPMYGSHRDDDTKIKISETIKWQRICCLCCKKEGGLSAMKRWHMDNCKSNTSNKKE